MRTLYVVEYKQNRARRWNTGSITFDKKYAAREAMLLSALQQHAVNTCQVRVRVFKEAKYG